MLSIIKYTIKQNKVNEVTPESSSFFSPLDAVSASGGRGDVGKVDDFDD
jgi:hypothetical protein